MKTISTLWGGMLLLLLTGGTACFKSGGPCEEPDFVTNSEVMLTVKDASGRYVYGEMAPLYPKDSLKVFNQDGEQLLLLYQLNEIPNSSMRYYEISFGPLYNRRDEASFSREICKNFIVQYRHQERDTLSVCFKTRNTGCGSEFETLKVYHKGRELADEANTVAAHVTLIRP
jgi:hypothetical protein